MDTASGDVLIDTLADCGVQVIFGLSGDGIDGVMETMRKRQDLIKFIQVRHEELPHSPRAVTPSTPASQTSASPPPLAFAMSTPGPVIVEALVDQFEPPMLPKATHEQTMNLAHSLLRGEPNREKIALTFISDKVRQLI
jgi:hypothetical protein